MGSIKSTVLYGLDFILSETLSIPLVDNVSQIVIEKTNNVNNYILNLFYVILKTRLNFSNQEEEIKLHTAIDYIKVK